MLATMRRFGLTTLVLILGLGLLAACGGTAATPPDERIEALFNDMGAAFNDQNITEAATQEEWAEKISMYFVPEQQATQKTELFATFSEMGGQFPVGAISIENVDAEIVSEEGDTAQIRLVDGVMVMDIPELGRQELPLTEGGLGTEGENATMRKIDGVWYLDAEN